jgi:hypothetical protein
MESLRQTLFQVPALLIAFVFFIFIYLLNSFGYAVKRKLSARHPDKDFSLGPAEGSLMGLMALLLAFSFGMASTKFEARRQTIVDEANALNTFYLRCTLYPDSLKNPLLHDLKEYVSERVAYYDAGYNPVKINESLTNSNKLLNNLWDVNKTSIANQDLRIRAEQVFVALINMKNIATEREAGRNATVPTLIIVVLLILVFASSFLTGYGLKLGNRHTVFAVAFAAMTSIVLFLVMELGRPRQGLINLETAENAIVSLKNNLP